jgi:hypothetical protein
MTPHCPHCDAPVRLKAVIGGIVFMSCPVGHGSMQRTVWR